MALMKSIFVHFYDDHILRKFEYFIRQKMVCLMELWKCEDTVKCVHVYSICNWHWGVMVDLLINVLKIRVLHKEW